MQPEQGQGPQPPDGEAARPRAGQAVVPADGTAGADGTDGPAGRPAPGDAPPPGPGAPPPPGPGTPQPAGTGTPPATHGAPLTKPRMFRLPGAIVAWWAWVIIAAVFLADIVATGRNHTAAEIAATVVFITGLVYACALRPRVVADPGGITVQNPLRDHRIPWGSVTGVDLKESVQVHCAKEPGAKRGKVIHSWALYAQRRSRLRAELRSQGDRRRLPRSSFAADERTSAEAQKLMRQPAAQIMATQLDDLAREARERGAAAGPRVVSWAWPAMAAIVIPGVVLVLVVAVFR